MRAVALLGPVANERHLRRFELPGVNLFSGNELDPTDQPEAALVFGGDGTIHRHLSGLALKQIPTLVVPMGSANDFAHTIGIATVEHALAAWQRFCNVGDNLRTIDLGTIQTLDEKPQRTQGQSRQQERSAMKTTLFPGKVSRWSRFTSSRRARVPISLRWARASCNRSCAAAARRSAS